MVSIFLPRPPVILHQAQVVGDALGIHGFEDAFGGLFPVTTFFHDAAQGDVDDAAAFEVDGVFRRSGQPPRVPKLLVQVDDRWEGGVAVVVLLSDERGLGACASAGL